MGTVRVVIRKCRKLKNGRYPLAIRLTHKRKVKYIFTGYSALESEWNGKYPTYLNNKHPNQNELNQHLVHLYGNAISHQLELEQLRKPFTVYDLHFKVVQKSSSKILFGFSTGVINQLTQARRIGNAECLKTAMSVVKRFSNGKDFHFEDIDNEWLIDFETYHYSRGNTSVNLGAS